MINIEDLQEEVLNELFGITNFSSTIRGLFNGKTPDSALNPTKKILDRKLNAANRIQQASGFLSDKSLNDVDIPTFLRQAMAKGADASKPEQAALRKTGYKAGPPGYNTYGKVGGAADTVSAATMADAAKRRSVYANKSYASIRETLDQTVNRLLNEMRLDGKVAKSQPVIEYVEDSELIRRIVEELLEGFIFDPVKHTTAGPVDPKTGLGSRVPGPLHDMEFQSVQHAWDIASQRTPSGEPMGDMNHLIVKPEEKKVEAPVPPAEQAPEGDVQDRLDPMKRIQPVAAPVK